MILIAIPIFITISALFWNFSNERKDNQRFLNALQFNHKRLLDKIKDYLDGKKYY